MTKGHKITQNNNAYLLDVMYVKYNSNNWLNDLGERGGGREGGRKPAIFITIIHNLQNLAFMAG